MAARQPCFAILYKSVTLGQICVASTQALYFPPFQAQPGLEVIFDVEVVPGFAIFRNGAVPGRGFFLC